MEPKSRPGHQKLWPELRFFNLVNNQLLGRQLTYFFNTFLDKRKYVFHHSIVTVQIVSLKRWRRAKERGEERKKRERKGKEKLPEDSGSF